MLLLLYIHDSKANSTASLHHGFRSSPRTRLQVPGTMVGEGRVVTDLPPSPQTQHADSG